MSPKDLLASRTFWGVVAVLLAQVLRMHGIEVDGVDLDGLTSDLLTMGGAALAVYGRIRAARPIGSVGGVRVVSRQGGKRMRRPFLWITVLLSILCLALTAPASAETPAKAPAFSVQIGTGHLWTGSGNYAYSLDSTQWQVSLAGSVYLTPRHGVTVAIARDGATLVEWARRHNFDTFDAPAFSYEYTLVDLAYRYTVNPGEKACVYTLIGPTGYFHGDTERLGVMGAVGLDYDLTARWFLNGQVAFRHVSRFLVPQANVVETRLALGYRF
ncbi:MAG: outer membrane beta-barrel protein [Acidobacteriota bacterium]